MCVPAQLERTLEQRIVEAWAAISTGGSELPVPILVDHARRPGQGAGVHVVRNRNVPSAFWRYGVACTTPGRAVVEAVRLAASDREAVAIIDMAAAARLVRPDEVVGEARAEEFGGRRLRGAVAHADARARSPMETRLHPIWMLDAGLPPPLINQPVWRLGGVDRRTRPALPRVGRPR